MAGLMRGKFEEELKRFHNPNAERTAKLFLDYVGVDVTEKWTFNPGGSAEGKKRLDSWVKLRGDAAHRCPRDALAKANRPHMVRREDLEKLVKLLRKLVIDTERALDEING